MPTLDLDIPQSVPQEINSVPRGPIISPEGIMRIDNSSLEHFATCARSAEYYLVRNKELNRSRAALSFGSLMHQLLESHYTEDILPSYRVARAAQIIAETELPVEEGEWRTSERAMETYISYLATCEFDDFSIMRESDGKPLVEIYFEQALGDVEFNAEFNGIYHKTLRVLWTGRIDAVIETGKEVFVMDHKTTTMLGPSFFADFENSQQTIGYTWAGQQFLGKPVAGLFLNALAIRKPSKAGTPFERHTKRYLYSQDRLEEWQHNTLVLVSDFLSHLDRKYFPMQTKWCVGKYGQCPYFDVCTLPQPQREAMLTSNFYRDVTWTPKNR